MLLHLMAVVSALSTQHHTTMFVSLHLPLLRKTWNMNISSNILCALQLPVRPEHSVLDQGQLGPPELHGALVVVDGCDLKEVQSLFRATGLLIDLHA